VSLATGRHRSLVGSLVLRSLLSGLLVARSTVKLDHRGIAALLRGREIADATREAAEAVADNVRSQNIRVGDRDGGTHEYDLPVTVSMYETDRAHAVVVLAHPAGDAVQAKHGALSKAAAEAGLDFRGA
jgi:hypothetical protein